MKQELINFKKYFIKNLGFVETPEIEIINDQEIHDEPIFEKVVLTSYDANKNYDWLNDNEKTYYSKKDKLFKYNFGALTIEVDYYKTANEINIQCQGIMGSKLLPYALYFLDKKHFYNLEGCEIVEKEIKKKLNQNEN